MSKLRNAELLILLENQEQLKDYQQSSQSNANKYACMIIFQHGNSKD